MDIWGSPFLVAVNSPAMLIGKEILGLIFQRLIRKGKL